LKLNFKCTSLKYFPDLAAVSQAVRQQATVAKMAEVSAKKLKCAEENNKWWFEKFCGRYFALILHKLVEENLLNKS
jgi:hypothetical protein